MGLRFEYTCPMIDKSIDDVMNYIDDEIKEIVDNNVPVEEDERASIIANHSDFLKEVVREEFENLRTINSDMRSTADKQIDDLSEDIVELNERIDELESDIRELS